MHSSSDARPGPFLRVLPALVLGLLLLFAFRGMLQGRLFYLRDVSQNHYPVRGLVTERLRSGDLPLGAATSLFMFPILAVAAIFILRGVRKRGREIG